MASGSRIISAQLRVGDSELPTHDLSTITAKIDAARKFAKLNRLLFLPCRDGKINQGVIKHCHDRGIAVYLWYKVLADNRIMPNPEEQTCDAFGKRGGGEAGLWSPIHDTDESYLFGCPRNEKYNNLLLSKCEQMLPSFDGLFADAIGYPLPSLGLEATFTCFCPSCMQQEPRLQDWRRRIHDLRDTLVSCTDADMERLGTFIGMAREFGLVDFYTYRTGLITSLAERYAKVARGAGKGFGLDVLSPALTFLAGHHYADLGRLADWLKPRIYCHTYGPSSIPLEYYCMATGAQKWASRASSTAIMKFISRSIDLEMPPSQHNLTHTFLPPEAAKSQIRKSLEDPAISVHPGIECSLHPDFDTELDAEMVKGYLDASSDAAGIVLAWNLLFIPDNFLRLVGEM